MREARVQCLISKSVILVTRACIRENSTRSGKQRMDVKSSTNEVCVYMGGNGDRYLNDQDSQATQRKRSKARFLDNSKIISRKTK